MEIRDEGIINKIKYTNIPAFTKEEAKVALDFVIAKIDNNIETFTDRFPSPASVNNNYYPTDNHGWTEGFWTGMLWLAYEYTKDDKYKRVAEIQCKSFKERIEKEIAVDMHDLGFLYTLSCVAGYKLTGKDEMRATAMKAADKLISRYQEKGQFIQAWGKLDDPASYRLIIDCLLNLPLLYWAGEVSGDKKYYEIGYHHAITTMQTVIREDCSTNHTFYFDMQTGAPLQGVTHQGYSNDSAWSRGQSWGIYGFVLSYLYTNNTNFFIHSKKLANYFLNRLPEDYICYWDLIFTDGKEQERDSSAAAIAACGLLELIKNLPDEYAMFYRCAVSAILRSLTTDYSTKGKADSNGILLHAVYAKPQRGGIDECTIWGDYFYMEALMRVYRDWRLYW